MSINLSSLFSSANLIGGSAGQVPFQTGSGTTSFTATGTTGQVLTSAGTGTPTWVNPLGVNQTWTNVAGSRSSGVTYTNSTGSPISVAVSTNSATSGIPAYFYINGNQVGTFATAASSQNVSLVYIVPNNSTYSVSVGSSLISWYELR